MVQVFLLTHGLLAETSAGTDAIDRVERAEDDGLRVAPEAVVRNASTPPA